MTASESNTSPRGEISSTGVFESSLRKLASTYRSAAVEQLLRFAKEIEDNASVPHAEKLATLMEAVFGISETIERLSRTAPEKASELWESRLDRDENAYDFTRRVYRDYLPRGLSQPDVRSLDPKLYQAILDRRRRSSDRSLSLPKRSGAKHSWLHERAFDRTFGATYEGWHENNDCDSRGTDRRRLGRVFCACGGGVGD